MEWLYQVAEQIHAVRVQRAGEVYRVSIDGAAPVEVRAREAEPGRWELEFGNRRPLVYIARDGQKRHAAIGSSVYELTIAERSAARTRPVGSTADESKLQADMPGQVVSVAVREGDEVSKGQTLVVLEAMKMELRVQAPYAGRVQRVLVEAGQVVERGQQLVELVNSEQ